jgi:hypothetical protein
MGRLARKIMPDPVLPLGEEILWRRPATLCLEGERNEVSGMLYLTRSLLIFNSNLLNRLSRRPQEDYPLASIARIEPVAPSWPRGGVQRRMRIHLADRSSAAFVVPGHVDEAMSYLTDVLKAQK